MGARKGEQSPVYNVQAMGEGSLEIRPKKGGSEGVGRREKIPGGNWVFTTWAEKIGRIGTIYERDSNRVSQAKRAQSSGVMTGGVGFRLCMGVISSEQEK